MAIEHRVQPTDPKSPPASVRAPGADDNQRGSAVPRNAPVVKSSLERSIAPADLVAIGLLCAAPFIRLALMTGPIGSDDINYFHFAQQLLGAEPLHLPHLHAGRLFFLLLAGFPAVLLGSITAGGVVSICFLSLRDVLVTLFIRRQCGAVGAAGAAAILSLNALSSLYAGLLLPDSLLSLVVFVSAALAFLASRAEGAARARLIVGAGVAAGIAYSVKDSGILVIPPTVAWLLLQRSETVGARMALASRYCLAFTAVVALEMTVYWLLAADPLYRYHAISTGHNAGMGGGRSFFEFAKLSYWNLHAVTSLGSGSLPVLVAAAALWTLAVLERGPLLFFAGTGAFIAAYLVFGTSSFTRLVPMYVQDRYFEPLVPFVAVTGGALMARVAGGPRSWVPPLALAAVVAATSFPGIALNAGDITFSTFGKNAAIAISALRSTQPSAPILVSPNFRFSIEPFVSKNVFDSLQVIPAEGPLPNGYYMLHAWRDRPGRVPRVSEVQALPIFLAVALDQRKIPLPWVRSLGPHDRATVWVKM